MPSLLPRWRGAAPIQRAIWPATHETGRALILKWIEVFDHRRLVALIENRRITRAMTTASCMTKLANVDGEYFCMVRCHGRVWSGGATVTTAIGRRPPAPPS